MTGRRNNLKIYNDVASDNITKLVAAGTHIYHDGKDAPYEDAVLYEKQKNAINILFKPGITKIGKNALEIVHAGGNLYRIVESSPVI